MRVSRTEAEGLPRADVSSGGSAPRWDLPPSPRQSRRAAFVSRSSGSVNPLTVSLPVISSGEQKEQKVPGNWVFLRLRFRGRRSATVTRPPLPAGNGYLRLVLKITLPRCNGTDGEKGSRYLMILLLFLYVIVDFKWVARTFTPEAPHFLTYITF